MLNEETSQTADEGKKHLQVNLLGYGLAGNTVKETVICRP
jgi:hypothetical protein